MLKVVETVSFDTGIEDLHGKILISVGKCTQVWENLHKCGKIYISVGKCTQAWENLQKR